MKQTPFCERCYKLQVDMRFRMPFDSPMPGIMFHLDGFQKKLVDAHFTTFDEAPAWLTGPELYSIADFPPKMTMDFAKYDITMVGMPDAVFRTASRKLYLVDFKSAKYKGQEDPFLPCYETQLLGYTHLLEANGIGEVEAAALVYFENTLSDYGEQPLDLITKNGFEVPFDVKVHPVEINRPDLWPLLKRVRKFADMQSVPAGLEKCKNCARLQALFDAEELRTNSLQSVPSKDENYFRKVLKPLIMQDKQRARSAWNMADEVVDACRLPEPGQDSIPAAWDV